ncbi:response regulator [Desulfococcaceae bacterium HSG8]|nr:response regulator [Desulfococcaceae bacterium HSG8]
MKKWKDSSDHVSRFTLHIFTIRGKMKRKVLVVDDDSTVCFLVKTWLSEADFEVEYVNSGEEALKNVHQIEPDIVISDVLMPGMDGYELKQWLLHNPQTAGIPFVFLSSQCEMTDQLKGLRTGADDYICKPFSKEELLDSMKKVMERAAHTRSFHTRADFIGNLAQTRLSDLIHILEMNRRSGELVVRNLKGSGIGSVFFLKGCIVKAASGLLEGEEAFYGLMGEEDGHFEFYARKIEGLGQIHMDNKSLLLNAERLIDTGRRLDTLLPDSDVLLRIEHRRTPPELMKRSDVRNLHKVLLMIDEQKTVREIFNCGFMSRPRAASVIADLFAADMISIRERKPLAEASQYPPEPMIDKRLSEALKDTEARSLTGILEFKLRPTKAAIYFQNGHIIHACHGEVTAKKALYRIFSEKSGIFDFTPQSVSVPRTIHDTLKRLFDEGNREIRGLQGLKRELFNGVAGIILHVSKETSIIRNIPNMEYILSLAQQYDRLEDIIDASNLTDFQTYNYMSYMNRMGIITISRQKTQLLVSPEIGR